VACTCPSAMPCWCLSCGGPGGRRPCLVGERPSTAAGGPWPAAAPTTAHLRLNGHGQPRTAERQLAERRPGLCLECPADGEQTTDGLKLRLGPSHWLMLRFSGTEPHAAAVFASPKPGSGWPPGAGLGAAFAEGGRSGGRSAMTERIQPPRPCPGDRQRQPRQKLPRCFTPCWGGGLGLNPQRAPQPGLEWRKPAQLRRQRPPQVRSGGAAHRPVGPSRRLRPERRCPRGAPGPPLARLPPAPTPSRIARAAAGKLPLQRQAGPVSPPCWRADPSGRTALSGGELLRD